MDKFYWYLAKEKDYWEDKTPARVNLALLRLSDVMEAEGGYPVLSVESPEGQTKLDFPYPDIELSKDCLIVRGWTELHPHRPLVETEWHAYPLTGPGGHRAPWAVSIVIEETGQLLVDADGVGFQQQLLHKAGGMRVVNRAEPWDWGHDEDALIGRLVISAARGKRIIDNYAIRHLLPSMFVLEGTTKHRGEEVGVVITVTPSQLPAAREALGG